MNIINKETIKSLTLWINGLIEEAKKDSNLSVSWFKGTDIKDFCIVGGWSDGFSKNYEGLLHISKSKPNYAMCVKIVVDEGPYAYADFDSLNMPIGLDGEVDDTCISIELDENPEALALFLLNELERITKEHGGCEE